MCTQVPQLCTQLGIFCIALHIIYIAGFSWWEAWGQLTWGHWVGNCESFTIKNTRLAGKKMHYWVFSDGQPN